MPIDFGDRGREGGREGERNTDVRDSDWVLLTKAPTGVRTLNPGKCPDLESNPQPLGPQEMLQPAEPAG